MAYRWHPKNAETDSENPRAWGVCDRCGLTYNLKDLVWQFSYLGTPVPQNTRFLVCTRTCLDPLNPQDSPPIVAPDPPPLYNARPENYTLDETDYASDGGGNNLVAYNGDNVITDGPNPDNNPNTSSLSLTKPLIYSGSQLPNPIYLDLFNGDPTRNGGSVLKAITGSSTRTNIFSQMTMTAMGAQNLATLTVASSAASATNVSYIGLYSAAQSGLLFVSGPIGSTRSIVAGAAVQFDALALTIIIS